MLTRAADGEQFKVNGTVTLENGFLKVPIKALGEVEAGKTYAVSLQMNLRGTVIGSNYFNIKVSDDFSAVSEDLGGVEIKSDYSPKDLDGGFKEMTIKGGDLLKLSNFKNLFSTLPDNAEFAVASQSKQPEGKAQEKYGILNQSLARTGAWEQMMEYSTGKKQGTNWTDELFNNNVPQQQYNVSMQW